METVGPTKLQFRGTPKGSREDHPQRGATSTWVYQQDGAKAQAGAGGRG